MRSLLLSASILILAACSPAATMPDSQVTAESAPTAETAAVVTEEVKLGATGAYSLDLTHSSLIWRVSHFGLSMYTGRFTEFDASLQFNPEDPTATSLTATVNPASLETDYRGDYKATHPTSTFASWNEDLAKNERWFNSDTFGAITFTTTEIDPATANTGKVTGDLTFLGVTKPVTLDVTYNGVTNFPWAPGVDKIGFSASTKINRSDFGMAALIPNIGDEVEIIIETEFAQVVAP